MLRKTALVTAMLGAFAGQVYALGLGGIELQSALNQPLKAEIQILGATPRELGELKVILAPPEDYARTGLERLHFLTQLKFDVVSGPDGKGIIRVSSREPVREPFLDFLIEASWSNGQMVREYTVLVDPPVLMPAPKPAAQAATVSPAPSASVTESRVSAPAAARQYAAGPGEYLTRRGDSLWRVAEQLRPDTGVTMEQTMLGLLEANADAFTANNINNLKAGYVMRIPSRDEMTAISAAEARSEVKRQNQAWREGRATVAPTSAPAASVSSPAASGGAAASTPAATAEAKLHLVAPEEKTAAGSGLGGGVTGLDDVRNELNIAVEAVEAQKQHNLELTDRLARLEDQIQQLHRLIELKDQELASLQDSQLATGESPLPATPSAEQTTAAPQEPAAASPAPAPQPMPETAPENSAGSSPLDEEIILNEQVLNEPEETAGPLDDLLNNPILVAGGAGIALLVLLLIWLGARKRRMASTEFQESILREREPASTTPPPPVSPVASSTAAAPAPEPTVPAEEPAATPGPQSDSSLFTDFAVSDMGSIQDDSEADPVAEADVYLAYGRFQQAEELVKSAMEKSPERQDLRLKLLEIYHAARNLGAFEDLAQTWAAELGTEGEDWERIAGMAAELNSAHPLFGGSEAEAEPTETFSETEASPAPAAEEAAEAAGEEEDQGLEFDLGGLEEFSSRQEESSAPTSLMDENALAEEVLDSDLTETSLETVVEESGPEVDLEEAEEGVLNTLDEVATKLDLARAYVEMGDPEGARSILDEVLEEGDDEQKAEAQELISQL